MLTELLAHAMASDLTGVRQLVDRIDEVAARTPGWVPYSFVAHGLLEALRGDTEAARSALEAALSQAAPGADGDGLHCLGPWLMAAGPYVEVLVQLGRSEDARAFALRTLEQCQQLEDDRSAPIVRALALAGATLGDYEAGARRLEALIEEQRAEGVYGLHLGASYETRARIAIIAGDQPAVERFGALSAEADAASCITRSC